MAGYKIQLKDKNGNKQYPVSTTNVVVDADGVSVADLLDRKQPTLVSGVNIKTINGKTLLGEGDLVIEGGTADLSGYATTEYVDAKVGEPYPIYYSYDGTPLTEEQKAANKMAIDKYVADESVVLYPYNSSVGHPFEVVLTLSEGAWKTAELTIYIFVSFNDDGTAMYYVKVTVNQDGDVQVEYSAQSPLVLASKAYVDSKVGSGLKYFVERYVYAGDTEEERTYNLESLAMAEQGVDILWAGLESIGLSTYIAAGAWYLRIEEGMLVSILEAHIDTDGTFAFQVRSFCRVFMPTTNTEMKEYMKAFFKEGNWPYEQAYYGVFPIISWSDETETSVKAYFLSNGLAIAHAVIDTETGEVGQAAVGQ